MNRKAFLNEFLGALGAIKIDYLQIDDFSISGIVYYNLEDLSDSQDFCWHMTEPNVPNYDVLNIVKLLKEKSLLKIDQITVKRNELLTMYNECYNMTFNSNEFDFLVDLLEDVEVAMINDGKETDVFVIHD